MEPALETDDLVQAWMELVAAFGEYAATMQAAYREMAEWQSGFSGRPSGEGAP